MKGKESSLIDEWDRNRKYSLHVNRIRALSSPKSKKRIKQEIELCESSSPDFPTIKHNQREELARKVKMENYKLVHRLIEIGRRKNNYSILDERTSSTVDMQAKAREAHLKLKMQKMQEQNDIIVDYITKKRTKSYLKDQYEHSLHKKKKSKKCPSSLSLPFICSDRVLGKNFDANEFS